MHGIVTYTADDHARMQLVRAFEDWLLWDIRRGGRRSDRERELLRKVRDALTALERALPERYPESFIALAHEGEDGYAHD